MVTTQAKPQAPAQIGAETYGLPAPIKLKLPADWDTSDETLIELSDLNEPWDFELTPDRELVIVSPEGPDSSERGIEISTDIGLWNRSVQAGHVYGAQLGVRVEDGSLRAPDAAWMSHERWARRNPDQGFLNVCPELIIEIVSPSNSFPEQQKKMQEWLSKGAQLGWLIDPFQELVIIYRPDSEPEQLDKPDSLDGEDVCEGLTVDLERIWK